MDDWVKRLENEYDELAKRYVKLCAALASGAIKADGESLYLLHRQRYVMSCYLDILYRRLEIAGVEVNKKCK